MLQRICVVLLAAGLLAGCLGTTRYTPTEDRNLRISTTTKAGSPLSTVRVDVAIYAVDRRCQADYRGTIDLDEPVLTTGISVQRPSYLVFHFSSASFFSNSRGTISYETLLTPRSGYDYDAEVSYANNIYNVVIREKGPASRAGRELDPRKLDACAVGRSAGVPATLPAPT